MAWFAELAGKAESLLTNIDEQTGAAFKNHNVVKQKKGDKNEILTYEVPTCQNRRHCTSPTRRPHNCLDRPSSPPKRLVPPFRTGTRQIDCPKEPPSRLRRSPTRKNCCNCDSNHCPKTEFNGDILKERNGDINPMNDQKKRRFSLPDDLSIIINEQFALKLQNLEVENAMLKNELNVMNREVSDLLDRLKRTEDDLDKVRNRVESTDKLNINLNEENNSLIIQVQSLQKKIEDNNNEVIKYKDINGSLENNLKQFKETNFELEQKIKQFQIQNNNNTKLESDLHQTQTYICELQNELERSKNECNRLEKDWEAYKLRVKSMLNTKDKEIKALQDGTHNTEYTKALEEQMDSLRYERNELTEAVQKVRSESDDMKKNIEQLELRTNSTDRVITALREAFMDERIAKNKAEEDSLLLKKELKLLQNETSHTIASLQTMLREKEEEVTNLKEPSTSMLVTTDSSALNVADYERQESAAEEKLRHLTQTLVGKQGRIDCLMADNNMLRIQLEKIATKFKNEVASHRGHHHSVVNVDTDARMRIRLPESVLSRVSIRIGQILRRNPLFRMVIIMYMVGLHLWVALVLLTYTPEVHPNILNSRI